MNAEERRAAAARGAIKAGQRIEAALSAPQGALSAPQGAPVLYVAFLYDPPINTPPGDDPRQYRAGTCLGAFTLKFAAECAVNVARQLDGTATWDQKYGEDDPTLFLCGTESRVFLGYVEEVPLERRVQERRK